MNTIDKNTNSPEEEIICEKIGCGRPALAESDFCSENCANTYREKEWQTPGASPEAVEIPEEVQLEELAADLGFRAYELMLRDDAAMINMLTELLFLRKQKNLLRNQEFFNPEKPKYFVNGYFDSRPLAEVFRRIINGLDIENPFDEKSRMPLWAAVEQIHQFIEDMASNLRTAIGWEISDQMETGAEMYQGVADVLAALFEQFLELPDDVREYLADEKQFFRLAK
jgi:hypothetical protein